MQRETDGYMTPLRDTRGEIRVPAAAHRTTRAKATVLYLGEQIQDKTDSEKGSNEIT